MFYILKVKNGYKRIIFFYWMEVCVIFEFFNNFLELRVSRIFYRSICDEWCDILLSEV